MISSGSIPPRQQRRVRDEAREPAADEGAPARRSLHRAGEQPLDEVALEREEHRERHDQRDERRGRDQVDVRAELAQVREDRDGDRLHVLAERQRDDQVVPRPEELEDRERRDRRQPERQDQPQKILSSEAPSIRADSMMSFGIPTKKFRSRKIANGSPNATWKRTIPSTVS